RRGPWRQGLVPRAVRSTPPPGTCVAPWPSPSAVALRDGGDMVGFARVVETPASWLARGVDAWSGFGHRPGGRSFGLANLLGEVIGFPRLGDERELRLEPVGVLLLGEEDPLQQLAAAVVAQAAAQLDGRVERRDGGLLDLEVQPELLGDGLAAGDLAQALQVRHALQVEDAGDEHVGVLHLVDGLRADLLPQSRGSPVLTPCGAPGV